MNNIQPKTDLMEYLPDWYKPVLDYQQIVGAEIPSFQSAETALESVHGNMFLDTLDSDGVSEWEKVFEILPLPTDTLQDRIDRVKNRLWMHSPFTERYLRQRLDELVGSTNYTLTFDRGNYKMTLASTVVAQEFTNETIRFVNTVKPAHIEFDIVLLFNRWNYIGIEYLNVTWVRGNLQWNTGLEVAATTRCRSGFIEVPKGDVHLRYSGSTVGFIPFYYGPTTSDFISYVSTYATSIDVTQSNCTYVRFLAKKNDGTPMYPSDFTDDTTISIGKMYTWGYLSSYTWQDAREDDTL